MVKGATASHREWLYLDEARQRMRAKWAEFFERYDVLLCPTAATTAFPHNQEGERWERMIDVNGKPQVDIGCAVQANSTSQSGMTQEGTAVVRAKKFGVTGGHKTNNYSPVPADGSPNGRCRPATHRHRPGRPPRATATPSATRSRAHRADRPNALS